MRNNHSGLLNAAQHWKRFFPQTYEFWARKAGQDEFWGPASSVCRRFGVPPDMLIPIVYSRLNDRPEDPHVNFHSNVMRSEALMTRSVRNFQRSMETEAKSLRNAHAVLKKKELRDFEDVSSTCRLMAELSLFYFRTLVKVKAAEIDAHHNPDNVPQVMKDVIAFRFCGFNPFLLVDLVEDPRLRHLAASNIQHLVSVQPWTFDIWEGLVRNTSLRNFGELAGPEPEQPTFEGGQAGYNWPIDPLGFNPLQHNPKHPELTSPGFFILCPQFDHHVDLYLEAKAERHRGIAGGPTTCTSP